MRPPAVPSRTLAGLAALAAVAEALVAAVLRAGRWLAVPLALLLFLQWPLREAVQAYSREANDVAQLLFAWYVALAVTAATRAGGHLAVELQPRRPGLWRRRLAAALVLAAAAALVVAAWPAVARAVAAREAFPDTFNPGYFLLKLALPASALCALLQALVDLLSGRGRS